MLKSGRGLLRLALLAALLTSFLFSIASATELKTLEPGDSGLEVANLKANLKNKGYYTVKKDTTEVYTASLASAVRVFQIANEIKPENYGYADEQTQIRAASDDAILYSDYIQDKQLQPGGSGDYVKKAQKQLTKLGYYAGKIDGRYRSLTVAAVKFFEKANSLVEDGIADRDTRTVLYSPDAKTRAKYEEENYLTPLNLGAKGEQVKKLQEQLSSLGFYWDVPSEVYDAQTKYSVKFFQEANGFSITGNASKTLRAKLNGDDTVSYKEYLDKNSNIQLVQLSSSARPGIKVAVLQRRLQELGYYKGVITGAYSGSVITAVRTFQIFNNMKSQYVTGKANTETRKLMLNEAAKTYGEVCGDDTLKLGDSGDAVKKLQARLKELGYYRGEVDGIFSGTVASAVRVFQRYNEFYPSGVAYTDVQVKLYSSKAVSFTNSKIEKLIEVAESKYGYEYTPGKRGPKEFDCSGFTSYCLKQVGVNVTAEVQSQGKQVSGLGKQIIKDYKDLRRGDIVFFWSPDHKKKPGHAGIFVEIKRGEYRFIHASSTYDKVTISNMKTDYYLGEKGAFLYGVRLWE